MPLFIRLFFVALLTQFLAVLLPVTERKAYDPLERTKHRVPVTGNDLAAHFALYARCITNCIFRGFGTVAMRPEWLFCEVCEMQALFFWPSLRCSCSRSGQLCSGYYAAGECHCQVSVKRKRKPNKASTFANNLLFRPDKEA